MKKNKHINYFAEQAKEDHTQPKGTPVNNNRNAEIVDPDEKAQRRNKIIK
jgi:hypothetical protein